MSKQTTLNIAFLIVLYFVLQRLNILLHVRLGIIEFLILIILAVGIIYILLNRIFKVKN